MRTHWMRLGGLLALMTPLVLASGCTGSEVLNPTSGDIVLSLELVNNQPGPFTDDPVGDPPNLIPADLAYSLMTQTMFRPTLADSDAALGPNDLGLLAQPFEANFNFVEGLQATARLTHQGYELSTVVLTEIFLWDRSDGNGGNDVKPQYFDDPLNPTCNDFVRFFLNDSSDQIQLIDFGGPVYLNAQGAGTPFKIKLDVEAFIDAFVDAHQCNSACNTCLANYDINNPSTFACSCQPGNFRMIEFRDAAPTYLSFE